VRLPRSRCAAPRCWRSRSPRREPALEELTVGNMRGVEVAAHKVLALEVAAGHAPARDVAA
jgi:hypothetical protein